MSAEKETLLAIADDRTVQQLAGIFSNYEVLTAADGEAAVQLLRRFEPSIAVLDLGCSPTAGDLPPALDILRRLLALSPDTKVIVLTDPHDRAGAVAAIGLGAYNFFEKPLDADILSLLVGRAFRMHELEAENRRLLQHPAYSPMQGILTASPPMLAVCRTIEKVAPADASVLLLGESGTGKELLARALHDLSPRSRRRFIAVNCAAIPETLLESELFGYEKGAFTGADTRHRGKIEFAHGGTFFLDEIGDLPLPLQGKLLRFLQERVIERIGGREELAVDVRIVCATHQDLRQLIKARRFREDLFYRISELTVAIPPLRARPGDAALLAHAFLEKYADQRHHAVRGFTPEALAAIEQYAYPGNVRELENCIKRAVIMTESPFITVADLGLAPPPAEDPQPINLRQVRENAERQALVKALGRTNGNIARAAGILGISRPTLYDLIDRFGLRIPRGSEASPPEPAAGAARHGLDA